MANRDCEGDFFAADGVRYYRCMWDGTVLVAPEPGSQCPNCKRDIAGQDHGRLETHTRRFVILPEAGWEADLPHNAALTGAEGVRVEGTVMQQTED